MLSRDAATRSAAAGRPACDIVSRFLQRVGAEVALGDGLGLDFMLVQLQGVVLDIGNAGRVGDLALDERTRLGGSAARAGDERGVELVGVC